MTEIVAIARLRGRNQLTLPDAIVQAARAGLPFDLCHLDAHVDR